MATYVSSVNQDLHVQVLFRFAEGVTSVIALESTDPDALEEWRHNYLDSGNNKDNIIFQGSIKEGLCGHFWFGDEPGSNNKGRNGYLHLCSDPQPLIWCLQTAYLVTTEKYKQEKLTGPTGF